MALGRVQSADRSEPQVRTLWTTVGNSLGKLCWERVKMQHELGRSGHGQKTLGNIVREKSSAAGVEGGSVDILDKQETVGNSIGGKIWWEGARMQHGRARHHGNCWRGMLGRNEHG